MRCDRLPELPLALEGTDEMGEGYFFDWIDRSSDRFAHFVSISFDSTNLGLATIGVSLLTTCCTLAVGLPSSRRAYCSCRCRSLSAAACSIRRHFVAAVTAMARLLGGRSSAVRSTRSRASK